MANAIFISYRRKDGAGSAGRISDRLEREFGRDQVFMDVNTIPLGEDFKENIVEKVMQCSVLLVIIGQTWLAKIYEKKTGIVDGPEDYVRLEVSTALYRGIPVIPVLIDGAELPSTKDLPNDLKDLAHRNALDVRHATFDSDIERLVQQLKAYVWKLPTLLETKSPAELIKSALLEMPLVVHNILWPHPAGLGIIPWMQVIARGSIVGASGKYLGLSALFYAGNGTPLFASPIERQYRTLNGQVVTSSLPSMITGNPGLISYILGIPYYALNLVPTNGMLCHPLAVVVQAFVDQELVGQSPPAPFFCTW
jgi:hypothetical protein